MKTIDCLIENVLQEDILSHIPGEKQNYLPNAISLGTIAERNLVLLQNKVRKGQSAIYVCQNKPVAFR
ncbi:MAG: hypothetical protein WBA74_02460 [Cyclobacteriaceae bacterium]